MKTFKSYIKEALIKKHAKNNIKMSDYIDLGLPSGNLWCIKNVGADKPEELGDLFEWDDIKNIKLKNGEAIPDYNDIIELNNHFGNKISFDKLVKVFSFNKGKKELKFKLAHSTWDDHELIWSSTPGPVRRNREVAYVLNVLVNQYTNVQCYNKKGKLPVRLILKNR